MLHDYFNKLIVFDIETASECRTLDELRDEKGQSKVDLWKKRCTWLRTRYPENSTMTDEELYTHKAALHPEFSKIICISIAQIKDSGKSITIKSYHGDEKSILTDFLKLNAAVLSKIPGSQYCGHNIKRFDVPFLAKRMVINGLPVPANFQIFKMKNWEIPFLDTSDIWSFGAWQESYVSLELLCNCLEVPTPKDGMEGKDVGKAFYSGRIKEIVEYCERDVEAVCKVLLKLSNMGIDIYADKR
jgi:predicted PolB exonuclease-like 3'-5' exonuclease